MAAAVPPAENKCCCELHVTMRRQAEHEGETFCTDMVTCAEDLECTVSVTRTAPHAPTVLRRLNQEWWGQASFDGMNSCLAQLTAPPSSCALHAATPCLCCRPHTLTHVQGNAPGGPDEWHRYLLRPSRVLQAQEQQQLRPATEAGLRALSRELVQPSEVGHPAREAFCCCSCCRRRLTTCCAV